LRDHDPREPPGGGGADGRGAARAGVPEGGVRDAPEGAAGADGAVPATPHGGGLHPDVAGGVAVPEGRRALRALHGRVHRAAQGAEAGGRGVAVPVALGGQRRGGGGGGRLRRGGGEGGAGEGAGRVEVAASVEADRQRVPRRAGGGRGDRHPGQGGGGGGRGADAAGEGRRPGLPGGGDAEPRAGRRGQLAPVQPAAAEGRAL